MLALKRMALLSKSESCASPTSPGEGKTLKHIPLTLWDINLQHNETYKEVKKFTDCQLHSTSLPFLSDSVFSPEAEHALQTLEHKMQGPPHFTQCLKDQTVTSGSGARLSCHLTGTPQGSD